ncbi:hypothetical protein TNCV_3254241 [Trichonephila clavipes]|nr:hypothetical protein TNCV_3254241 [Trichonephila clavipes]
MLLSSKSLGQNGSIVSSVVSAQVPIAELAERWTELPPVRIPAPADLSKDWNLYATRDYTLKPHSLTRITVSGYQTRGDINVVLDGSKHLLFEKILLHRPWYPHTVTEKVMCHVLFFHGSPIWLLATEIDEADREKDGIYYPASPPNLSRSSKEVHSSIKQTIRFILTLGARYNTGLRTCPTGDELCFYTNIQNNQYALKNDLDSSRT